MNQQKKSFQTEIPSGKTRRVYTIHEPRPTPPPRCSRTPSYRDLPQGATLSRRIAVVGAGLAGVTTAYELAALGAEVQVFERGGSVAEQASFASSALLSPAAPGLVDDDVPAPWAFRLQRWRASSKGSDARAQLAALSRLSLARSDELRHELGLEDEPAHGLMVACTDGKRAAAASARLDGWRSLGLVVDLLEAGEARLREPGLNPEAPLAAALALAGGGVGNPRLFAQQLRQHARRLGAAFRFHTTVRAVTGDATGLSLRHEYTPPMEAPSRGIERDAGDTVPQVPGQREERFDAVVLCNGLGAGNLLGHRLPVAARHEASVTAPLRLLEAHPDLGPKAAWLDPSRGITITRLGQRVRITGGITITHAGARFGPDFEALHRALQHWFPGSVLHQQVQQGSARRAVVADGLPLIGASHRTGVWLNLSPGGQGWGLACGTARLVAEQVLGITPRLDISALGPQRVP